MVICLCLFFSFEVGFCSSFGIMVHCISTDGYWCRLLLFQPKLSGRDKKEIHTYFNQLRISYLWIDYQGSTNY